MGGGGGKSLKGFISMSSWNLIDKNLCCFCELVGGALIDPDCQHGKGI